VDNISTNRTSEDLKLPEKATEERIEGLRLLFRNKYVQTEAAFWSKGQTPPVPRFPKG
jgi:hypothetical protein